MSDLVQLQPFDQHNRALQSDVHPVDPRIFAAGDICSKYKFTHAADFRKDPHEAWRRQDHRRDHCGGERG